MLGGDTGSHTARRPACVVSLLCRRHGCYHTYRSGCRDRAQYGSPCIDEAPGRHGELGTTSARVKTPNGRAELRCSSRHRTRRAGTWKHGGPEVTSPDFGATVAAPAVGITSSGESLHEISRFPYARHRDVLIKLRCIFIPKVPCCSAQPARSNHGTWPSFSAKA